MNPEIDQSVTNCGNCRSPMPRALRFCRNCGFRLGEGSAEYTETVRFQNLPAGTLGNNSSTASGAPYGFAGLATSQGGPIKKRRRRMSGMSWLFIGLLIFFVAAAAFTAIRTSQPDINVQFGDSTPPALSFVGVNEFETTDGGVTFENVEPPGSPADKAGLVGGDVITSFDGHPVTSADEMRDLMSQTPVGKTVDLEFLRDGEAKTAKLTTISEAERERLEEVFKNRPAGRPLFGYDDGAAKRVPVPDTKMFGVRLGEISPNRPADIAGVKEGDIVIELNGVPIRTPEEFLSRVRRAEPYSTITVGVMRGSEKIDIPVKVGKQ